MNQKMYFEKPDTSSEKNKDLVHITLWRENRYFRCGNRSRSPGNFVFTPTKLFSQQNEPVSDTSDMTVYITAVPIIKLFAWGEGDSRGHVLRETTSRGLCGLVCPHALVNAGEREIV
jgi:hypothetical protein